jgi:hypothetical protein
MSWMDQITNVLQNYSQSSGGQPPNEGEVEQHFGQVAQVAPQGDLANSIAAMFRGSETPPFAQQISQLFTNSNPEQRANLLNTLLSSGAGAGILAQLAKSAGVSLPIGTETQITPEQAAQIPPGAVQQAAAHAEQHDPSIVDRVSQIYAQHPALIKTLGVAAMSMAMSHLANRR